MSSNSSLLASIWRHTNTTISWDLGVPSDANKLGERKNRKREKLLVEWESMRDSFKEMDRLVINSHAMANLHWHHIVLTTCDSPVASSDRPSVHGLTKREFYETK